MLLQLDRLVARITVLLTNFDLLRECMLAILALFARFSRPQEYEMFKQLNILTDKGHVDFVNQTTIFFYHWDMRGL